MSALVLLLALAPAQIVNVQPLVSGQDQDGFSGSLTGSADWRTGNSELILLEGSLVARYRNGPHLVFLLGKAEFGASGPVKFSNRDMEHLRYRYTALENLQLETLVQHARDAFQRQALRVLWGAGPRFVWSLPDVLDAAVGVAGMLELERLAHDDAPDAGEELRDVRLSSYLSLCFKINSTLRVSETVYVQPRADRFRDLRILSEAELLVTLAPHFALKVASGIAYDSEPPATLERLNTKLTTGLEVSF
jgi:putative salt-induced outer membrane protein YdiY